MKQMIFTLVLLILFSALPASGSMVRGTISDSATGAPIGNVKVIVAQLQGDGRGNERETKAQQWQEILGGRTSP